MPVRSSATLLRVKGLPARANGGVGREAGVGAAWIEEGRFGVRIAGVMYPVEVSLGAFYDLGGKHMRG